MKKPFRLYLKWITDSLSIRGESQDDSCISFVTITAMRFTYFLFFRRKGLIVSRIEIHIINEIISLFPQSTMATKEQERAELHRAIWQIANDLRGSVDGWDFKQYVLGMLFYRFISENLTNYLNEEERKVDGSSDFDYIKLDDASAEFGRKDTILSKGFYILPSELFQNVRKNARNDKDLNVTLTRIFRNIESSAK